MSAGPCEPRRHAAAYSHGLVLAASLAIVITTGAAALLFRPRATAPRSADHVPVAPVVRPTAPAPPEPHSPAGAAREAITGLTAAPTGAVAAKDSLAALHEALPALEETAWNEAAAALLADFEPKQLPRALGALALELAGVVSTASGQGTGELTHPIVLTRLLTEVLARDGKPLTAEQREQAASLAARAAEDLEGALAAAASRPRLATIVAEVELKLDLVERLGEMFNAPQRATLDRLVSASAGAGAPLSPLTLLEVREMDVDPDAAACQRLMAAELARELQIDPSIAAALAAALHGGLSSLFDVSTADLSLPERALIAARAQARMLEDLLRSPALSAEARDRVLRVRTVAVPRAR